MMRSFLLLGVLLFMLMDGCKSPVQERPGVPLIFGMRLDGGTTESDVEDNFAWLREHDYTDILVEVPFRSTSLPPFVPYLDSLMLEQVSALAVKAHAYHFKLHLAVMTTNQRELFPEGDFPKSDSWFRQLEFLGHALLHACGPYPPERLVFGENLQAPESYAASWRSVFDRLRAKWHLPVSYCAYSNRETADALWAVSDEICLSYSAAAEMNALPFCRAQNMRISALADSLGKPVFIVRSNLLGGQKVDLFQYRLRYWRPSVPLEGMTINSIYSRISPLDSSSYYGIMEEEGLLESFEEYRELEVE